MLLGENLSSFDPKKTILILPAISVGNVGQLAVDLLITHFKLDHFARVDGHDCVLPVVGNDPFLGGEQLCTSFTAYRNGQLNVLVFQQRSDFLREKKREYLNRLVDWLKRTPFRAIFVLSSAFAHERADAQLKLNPLQYRSTPKGTAYLSESKVQTKDCNATKMEWTIPKVNDGETYQQRELPGSGIAQALYEKCVEFELPLIVISKYVSEGDNKMDSCHVASACAGLLGLAEVPKKWTIPKSWRTQDS